MWKRITIQDWYGEARRQIEITSDTTVWFHPGLPALPIRWVLIRDPKGKFKSQALLRTDLQAEPKQIIERFVKRWQLKVTLQEACAHLGIETQRQWSDEAIARTTPVPLSLFSLVTLLAHRSTRRRKLPIRQAAWYHTALPTFSGALAVVRYAVWHQPSFQTSRSERDIAKSQILCSVALPTRFVTRLARNLDKAE